MAPSPSTYVDAHVFERCSDCAKRWRNAAHENNTFLIKN